MIFIAALLGGIGLACVVYKRSLLGALIGIQILILAAAMMFVLAGAVSATTAANGHILGLLVTLGGVGQMVVGYAFSVRLFYLKKRVSLDELRSLKH